jgi:hypothetical protein
MTLTYKLEQNDYLQLHLFVASKSARVNQNRKNTWLIFSVIMFFLCGIFYENNNRVMFYYFLIGGVGVFISFPRYQRYYYRTYYNDVVSDIYKNRFGQIVNMKFMDNTIETSDVTGESKINLTNLENVTEAGDYFFPKLKSGGHLIIPKAQDGNTNELRNVLKEICHRFNIEFIEDLNWKWQ